MSLTVTIDQTEHTFSCLTFPGEFDHGHVGPGRYLALCSCGWRGTPVAGLGNDIAQWNHHVRTGEL